MTSRPGRPVVQRRLPDSDPEVRRLARLFLEHPAWKQAAKHIAEGSPSKIFFTHRPGESWHLMRRRGRSLLLPGPARDPDFAFRFSPQAIARLAAVEGDVGDFAVALFSLIGERDESLRVGFRVIAPWSRLLRRGYVRLLLAGGPEVLAYGLAHGVATLPKLRRLVAQWRARGPESWEVA